MRGLLGLLARSTSARPGRGLPRGPCSPSGGHHRLFVSSPSPTAPRSHPDLPTAGGHSFDRLFRSWRPHRDSAGSGLLGLLPARRALPSCWERRLMVVCGAVRSAVRSGALGDRGFSWMTFSLQKRGGFRVDNYYRRWNFWAQLSSLGRKRTSWMPTADGVIMGLIGVNVAVFVLWKVANPRFMMENFTISLDNFKSGYLHTLITSAFSHIDGDHLLINMFGFYFFGTNIGRLFGPKFLLKLYMAGAVSGSIFYLLHNAAVASSKGMNSAFHSREYALGASAAVNAILLLDVFLFPKNIIYLNFFIPVPAALLGAIIIGSDLWRIKRGDESISGSAHLGGALVAALVWARIKKRWI